MVSHFLNWKLYQSKQINVQCVVIIFGYRFNFWPHKIYHIFIQSRTCSCMVLNICAGEHHPASSSLVSSTHCLSLQFWATLPSLCGSLHKCCSAVLSRIKLIFLLEKKYTLLFYQICQRNFCLFSFCVIPACYNTSHYHVSFMGLTSNLCPALPCRQRLLIRFLVTLTRIITQILY